MHQQSKKAPLLLLPDPADHEKGKAPSSQPIAPAHAAAAAAAMVMFEPDANKDYSVFDLQPARVSSSQWRLLKGKGNSKSKSHKAGDEDTITTSSSSVQSRFANERRRTIYPVNGAIPLRSSPPTKKRSSPSTNRRSSPTNRRINSPPHSSWDVTIVSPEQQKNKMPMHVSSPLMRPDASLSRRKDLQHTNNSNINSTTATTGLSPKRPRPYSPYTDEIPMVIMNGEDVSDSDTPLRYQQRATMVTEGSGLKMGSTSLYSLSKLDSHPTEPPSTAMPLATAPLATIRKIDFLTAIKRSNPSFLTAVTNKLKTSRSAAAMTMSINDDLSSISSMDFGVSEGSIAEAVPAVTHQSMQQKAPHHTSLSALDVKKTADVGDSTNNRMGNLIIRSNSPSRIKKGATVLENKSYSKTKAFGAFLVKTDSSVSTDSKMNAVAAKTTSEQHRASQISSSAINHDLRFDEAVKKHNIKNIERMLRQEEKLSGLCSALMITAPLGRKAKNSQTVLASTGGVPTQQSIVDDNRSSTASIKDKFSDSGNPIPSDQTLPVDFLDHDSASDKGFLKYLEGGGKHFRDSFESVLSRDEDNINTHRSEKRNDDGRGEGDGMLEGMLVATNTRKDSSDSIAIPDVALQYLEALQSVDGDDLSSITLSSLRHPSRQSLAIKSISTSILDSPPLNGNSSTNNNNHNNNNNNNNNSPQRALSSDGSLRKPSSVGPPNTTTTATVLVMPMVHHTDKSKNKKILHMRSYVDEEGKLQGEDFLVEKNLFETLRDTDLVLDPPPDFNAMRLQHKDTTRLATIKHPYLSLPGVKPVKYPKELSRGTTSVRQPYSIDMLHSQFAQMVNAPQLNLQTIADNSIDNIHKKQATQQLKTIAENTDDVAVAEPVFLGNSSAYIVSTDAYSSYARRSKSAPWLPNGSLEPMETNRSNKRLGMQEKFDLLRYSPHDPSKQIMTIKGQEAARNAFESFVSTQITM